MLAPFGCRSGAFGLSMRNPSIWPAGLLSSRNCEAALLTYRHLNEAILRYSMTR